MEEAIAEHAPAAGHLAAPVQPPLSPCPLMSDETEDHVEEAKRSRVGSEEEDNEATEDEDGLVLLPRHTKVVVTGNNRTKATLVGLQGVVQKVRRRL
jgi:hypothetical protein